MSCLGGADLHHLLSNMFCKGLAKRWFSCWVAASISPSSNFSLEVSYPSSSTRLKIHSEGEVCHTACFSLKKTDALYRNFLNYAWIFECVFHWSCKEMSVVLVGWMGGAELHHLPADLSYQRLPDITSQLLLHFICFFYLHLRNCYHASSSCFGLSPFSASSLKSGISPRVRVWVVQKNHLEDKNTDRLTAYIWVNGSLGGEEGLKDWLEEKEYS